MRIVWTKPTGLLLLAGLAGLFAAPPAQAQDFYAGKQINMLVGSAVGGGYDAYARLVARHWTKHIPGHPNIVIQNMPAAGSLAAMNTLVNTSPRDGLTIAAVQNHIGVEPLLGITGPVENMRYDPRTAQWIGSATKEIPVVVAWSNSGVKTFRDMIGREIIMASTGTATADAVYARILNELVGTKFKIIAGYKGNPDIIIAAERGEVVGRAGWFVSGMLATQGQQIAEGKILVLVQLSTSQKHPALPNVPLVTEFLNDKEKLAQLDFSLASLAMGRPYVAPPGVPADRVKILRDSFMATMASPELLAEAKAMGLDVIPLSGEEVQALVQKFYDTPKSLIDAVRAMMLAK